MEPTSVAEFLTRHNLSTYADAFDAHGWDDISQLFSVPETHDIVVVNSTQQTTGICINTRAGQKESHLVLSCCLELEQELRRDGREFGVGHTAQLLKGSKLGSIRRRVQAKAATTCSTAAARLCFHAVCVLVCT